MQKLRENQSFLLLFFLALFGFSVGLFDNYRELWMSSNGLSTATISHVISVSYVVTVFVLFFFTIRVATDKLKWGVCLSLFFSMLTGTILICLQGTMNTFFIKFFMFFNIAFNQLVLASVYPLLMYIAKDDVLYTKKSFIESLFSKLGFLFAAMLLGKSLFSKVVDYNFCLLLAVFFTFLSMAVLLSVSMNVKEKGSCFQIKETFHYFQTHKIFYFFLFVNMLGDMVWGVVLGMPMLLLTTRFSFSSSFASYFILGLGILSNALAMMVVKRFRFKNDQYNLFFKFGFRVVLYLLVCLTNNSWVLLGTLVYLFLTDCPYGFILSGFFINHIEEKYALFLTTLKYCTSLFGKAIGTFLCGVVFSLDIRYFIFPALVLSIIHYFLASLLVKRRVFLSK